MKSLNEAEFRTTMARNQLKLEALDWMDKVAPVQRHRHDCASQDLTGHPAPCTCGADAANRLSNFIRDVIVKAI